jgi:hypothetical protein
MTAGKPEWRRDHQSRGLRATRHMARGTDGPASNFRNQPVRWHGNGFPVVLFRP